MQNFKAIEPVLFYAFPLEVQEQAKLDAFLELLNSSGVARYLTHCEANLNGRPAFDPYRLFAAILFAFSLGYSSLREIESIL